MATTEDSRHYPSDENSHVWTQIQIFNRNEESAVAFSTLRIKVGDHSTLMYFTGDDGTEARRVARKIRDSLGANLQASG